MTQDSKDQEIIYDENEDMAGDADLDIDEAKKIITKAKEKLKKCQEEKQEYLSGWQREKADFINFKRRQEEQAADWLKIAQAGLIKELLPVLDTLDAGIRNYDLGLENEENIKVKPIRDQLFDILKKHGVEEISTKGQKFNPELHEAIEIVESENDEEGIIGEEMQKGYLLNGKVLRTSKVKVTKNI